MGKADLDAPGLAARLARALAVPVALLALWQLAAVSGLVNPHILPSPWQVLRRWAAYASPTEPLAQGMNPLAWAFSGELPHDALATAVRVAVGFAIGAGLALPLGLAMGSFDRVYNLLNPLLQVLRPIPPIAYIPLAILWFGLGNPPAYFLISLGAFFPVLMNTIAGVRQVDRIYIRAGRNLGAGSATMFTRIILPAATPLILTGMRVGVGVAFICVIVAEMIAVNDGLGFRILEAREFFWSDKIIAGMLTIGLMGLAIDTCMDRLNAHLLRWHRGAGGR
ncbi:Putative aliphatic sulfonates transport permease protein SsuC [Fundidesulfovibrio magnetotacticus]|uniref:Aliphatic sulfonates transport permease protein SsuC n=1 Tax=Fundidesulfovibrio magnetotacticus TaxID=2730080 RepID=A0A6V8LSD9_9BACT|nr:ABC transporter permease [Fundidesulfovibrio magnetotacticus]GFK95392.1 Putative aliphatic sulfonates transport permease protein SsuC [Fundidesulfovibrio magnetotacticus]